MSGMEGKTLTPNLNAPGYKTAKIPPGTMRTRLRGKEVVATNKPGMQKAYKPYVKPRIDTHFHQDKTEAVTTPSPPELSATQKMQLKELVLENEKRKILQKKEDEEFLRQAAIKADLEKKKLEDEAQALKIAEEDRIRAEQNNEGITDSIQTPDKELKTTPSETKSTKTDEPVHQATVKQKEKKLRETDTDTGRKRTTFRRRDSKKINLQTATDEVRQQSHAAYLRREERKKRKALDPHVVREKIVREVQLPETIVVQELANRMAERVTDVIKLMMKSGVVVTQNQFLDADTSEIIIEEFGHKVVRVSDSDVEDVIESIADRPEDLQPRAPVITVMGHVDHGKTSLLDAIRKTSIASDEAGGITQHIGAYQVTAENGSQLTFLDTPGHSAFSSMRARGANITDIVVLVVAADDAVMPQTVEAINHATAANVPIIVAINKCDREDANPDKVRDDLLRQGIIVEKRSGEVLDVEISALTGQGVDELLELISLQAELLELKANPNRLAEGVVVEAQLDVGKGPVATILVQNGSLHKGDIIVVGEEWGKVRALINEHERRVDSAEPSTPVEVLGLNATPQAGDILNVVENETQAREISSYRRKLAREKSASAGAITNLENIRKIRDGIEDSAFKELNMVIKADVQGSVEAIAQAVEEIGNQEVKVRVLHSSVGAITENDLNLAQSTNAVVVGFNVRANTPARQVASQKGVEIRYYTVIYRLVDDIKDIASGLLDAKIDEIYLGNAEILQTFKITGSGMVAGCRVTEGVVRRASAVRLLRDNIIIHEGKLRTLKRFQDEVSEVHSGQECGMAFENYTNINQGDVIEIFDRVETKQSL